MTDTHGDSSNSCPIANLKVTSSALYLFIDFIKSLESIAQLGEKKIKRIVMSNFDIPTLGVSLFL